MKHSNIKEGGWLLHPNYPYIPLVVWEVRDEELDGTRTLVVAKTPVEGVHKFNVLLHDCVGLYTQEPLKEVVIDPTQSPVKLTEEEVLKNQLLELKNKKNQEEQEQQERDLYDAFLRCRNSNYIIEKWDHSNGLTMRKISDVKISGIFGKPVESNYRGFDHNMQVTCIVHETITMFQGDDYTTEEEIGYDGIAKTGTVNINVETFSKPINSKFRNDFIQKKNYPIEPKNYMNAKYFALQNVERMKNFFSNDFKLEEL